MENTVILSIKQYESLLKDSLELQDLCKFDRNKDRIFSIIDTRDINWGKKFLAINPTEADKIMLDKISQLELMNLDLKHELKSEQDRVDMLLKRSVKKPWSLWS